jgi:beta-1,4-N-acetylglucosaminyltransferase
MDSLFFLPWLWVILVTLIILFVRTMFVLKTIQRHRESLSLNNRPCRKSFPIKTLVVLGSGGHTTEMLTLIKDLEEQVYAPLIYMVATTDDTSERRVAAIVGGRRPEAIVYIPRSREVGQPYVTSVVTTLWSFLVALYWVARVRPNLLLCNGPGTCLPVAIATLVYRILGICEGNIVFVESFCRVTSFSLTGRLLYPVADMFVVHWEELKALYPKCHTVSTFVPNKTKRT